MNWWKALVDLSMSKESLMNSSLSEGFEKTKPVGSGGRSAFALPLTAAVSLGGGGGASSQFRYASVVCSYTCE